MSYLGRVWSKAVRLRNRRFGSLPDQSGVVPFQYEWIREHAPGRSFADIGGLWMRAGDVAFAAEEAGATEVTCFDVGDPDLSEFATKRSERGSAVRYVQGNLEDPESVKGIGPHDVVWCTGVLYHTPHPVLQLMHLREITRELLFLGTLTIPEIPGFPQASVFFPHMFAADRRPFAAGYDWGPKLPEGLLAIGSEFDERPMHGYGNCWWGITHSALRAMLRTARFEVVSEHHFSASPFQIHVVARPIDEDPLMPPQDYYRRRGELRQETGERLPFADHYERHG